MPFPRTQPTPTGARARLLALGGVACVAALAPPAAAHAAGDFEQPLPEAQRVADHADDAHGADRAHDHDPVTHRTGTILAPARFDAVGIARELRLVEFRVRERGGTWSRWVEVANGDPAWFGGARKLQVRTRGWRPRGRLHYVNVPRPTQAARRAVAKPDIVSRAAWGADRGKRRGCRPRTKPSYGRVKATVVHHTVGSNTYTEAEAPSVVLAICRYHRNALGWSDIGYNALVDHYGNIYAGRDGGLGKAVIGAHAQGVNALTSGVAVLGTHTKKPVSADGMRGLTRWLAWKLVRHGKTAEGRPRLTSAGGSTSRYDEGERFRMARIAGHRRTNLTECPGDGLNSQIPTLRRRVQARIEKFSGETPPKSGGIG